MARESRNTQRGVHTRTKSTSAACTTLSPPSQRHNGVPTFLTCSKGLLFCLACLQLSPPLVSLRARSENTSCTHIYSHCTHFTYALRARLAFSWFFQPTPYPETPLGLVHTQTQTHTGTNDKFNTDEEIKMAAKLLLMRKREIERKREKERERVCVYTEAHAHTQTTPQSL